MLTTKLETGVKTVEHKTITIQQRILTWTLAGSFIAGFALNGWATATTANAATKHGITPSTLIQTPPTSLAGKQ